MYYIYFTVLFKKIYISKQMKKYYKNSCLQIAFTCSKN